MKHYRTVQGDTWDMIAKKVYGDEKKLDILMQRNFDFLDYLVFPAGIVIECPEEPEESRSDLPIWRRSL